MASVPTGTKLGRYQVVKPLASGGMAELLLARTKPTERPLVLKWIRPEQAIDGAFIDAFVSEGRRAAQLHHPNIVEVHEVGREDGTHYLAMEYVHGDDLRKLLARLHERRAKLPVQHILAITTGIAQALQHAHEQTDTDGAPVLHLGIKPANVIVTAEGSVKLADFAIGRAALTEGRTDLLPSIVGYLSPEQCAGQPVDQRSDVFALGILMYELAVGRRLFKGDNEFVTMAAIVAGDIPPPTKHRGDLPKELEAVILRALARAPEDRFQSAQELHTALDKFATKAGVRGSLTTLAGYTKRLFGVRPEPWLVDDDAASDHGTASNDFDGAPKGLAMPPPEALQGCSLPAFVHAADDSPIMRVRKQVTRDLPTEQLNLANLKAAGSPDKSTPVKIPAPPATNGHGSRPLPKPLLNRPTPQPARTKPKTVQIPVQTADRIVKEESTKVMVPPREEKREENMIEEKTNVLVQPDLYDDKDAVTKESRQMAAVAERAMTPTVPSKPADLADRAKTTPRTIKAGDEDTIPAADTMTKNGAAKPLVSLAGLRAADEKREAAKKAMKAESAPKLPKPAIGPIKPPPPSERTDTDVDELTVESTAVANPPPMPIVVPTTGARDNTEHVRPLPSPEDKGSITTTDEIITNRGKNKLLIFGGAAAIAVVAIIAVVIGLGGDKVEPQPASNVAADEDQPATGEPERAPEQPQEASVLRTADTPRTPRNSHVTTDDEPKPEEPTPVEPEPEEQIVIEPPEPPPPAKQPKEPPPPPKFEEPKDPSPPDDEVAAKPAKKPTKPTKPKVTAAAQKPKPKPKAKPKPKPTTKGTWDPNSLFPKK